MNTDTVDNTAIHTDENAFNLVTVVDQLMLKHGHPHPYEWKRHLNPDANITNDPSIQRFLINRAMRMLFADVPEENTLDIRYCLVDQGEISDWIRLFESEVLPCLIRLNLPRPKH